MEREDSDLDLAVYVNKEATSIKDEMKIALNIADILKIPVERVNVVTLNSADVTLLARIFRDSIPIYSRNEDFRRKWERKAYREILMEMDLYAVYANRTFKRKHSAT